VDIEYKINKDLKNTRSTRKRGHVLEAQKPSSSCHTREKLNSLNLMCINQFLLLLSNCATIVTPQNAIGRRLSENHVFHSSGSSYSQNYPSPLWEICRKWRFSRRGCTEAIPQSWITRIRTSVIWTLSRSTSFPRRRASSWSTWSIKSPARYYRSSRFRRDAKGRSSII